MQRLLRNSSSGLFLQGTGTWTSRFADAKRFGDFKDLLTTASSLDEGELEEILIIGDEPSEYDVVLPIRSASRPGLK